MSNIRQIDMMFLNDIFEMNSGYVLDFSDKTFAQFFAEELNIDINDLVYAQTGNSKGKRLRSFLQIVDKPTVVKTLKALWEYREALRQRSNQTDTIKNAHGRFLELINLLEVKQTMLLSQVKFLPLLSTAQNSHNSRRNFSLYRS